MGTNRSGAETTWVAAAIGENSEEARENDRARSLPRGPHVKRRLPERGRGSIKRFTHRQFDKRTLLEAKKDTTVSVLVPALNEEPTIGKVVAVLAGLRRSGLLDEILVVDSGSTDRTREIAGAEGADVVLDWEILPELGPAKGKGEAMYKGLAASRGDVVAWVDADVVDFDERFVIGLLGPLLMDPGVVFVKAYYARPLALDRSEPQDPRSSYPGERSGGGTGTTPERSAEVGRVVPGEGGRVTELTARPLLACLFPAVAAVSQPLAGEYAGRRWLLEQIPFDAGYGVDVGILIDVVLLAGSDRIAECDLEIRHHRNRPLSELAPMAAEVAYAVLRRFPGLAPALAELAPQGRFGGYLSPERTIQRPPLATVRRS